MYYAKHIFLCTNQKPPGKTCCANSGGASFFNDAKEHLKARHLQFSKPAALKIMRTILQVGKSGSNIQLVRSRVTAQAKY